MGIFNKLFGGKKYIKIKKPKSLTFISSEELMEDETFWSIIKITKDNSHDNFELQQKELANQLRKLTPDEIILFGNRFRSYRGLAYTWELWGAIYMIQGGCGDDSFNDFREWVIGQGKEFYNKTITDPETLVEVETAKMEDSDWEGLGYVPGTVFEEVTGQEMPYPFQENLDITGTEWEEGGDQLENLFPRLYEKYSHNI